MGSEIGRGTAGRWTRGRGQGGYTLLEAVIALVVIAVAVTAMATGLLTSAKADNAANLHQKLSLAAATFSDNLEYAPPPAGCDTVAPSPAPTSGNYATFPAGSHGAALLRNTVLASGPGSRPENAQVAAWVQRGVVYSITKVEYADWQVRTGSEKWDLPCTDTGPPGTPLTRAPYYPVIRVTLRTCWNGTSAATICAPDSPLETTQLVRRGER